MRGALKDYLKTVSGMFDVKWSFVKWYQVLKDCVTFVEHGQRKTVTVTDVSTIVILHWWGLANGQLQVIFALRRIGRPIYGFGVDPSRPMRG